MSLAAQIAADVSAVFLNADDFAETITYYRKTEPGKPRQVQAVVDRASLKDESQQYRTETRGLLVVQCSTDPTDGISDPQVGDAIRLAEDASAVRHPFVATRHTAAGMAVLEFRRLDLVRAGDKARVR